MLVVDPRTCPDSGLPARAMPAGFIGNNTVPANLMVASDGSMQAAPEANQRPALLQALCQAATTVRRAVLALRRPGACMQSLLGVEEVSTLPLRFCTLHRVDCMPRWAWVSF